MTPADELQTAAQSMRRDIGLPRTDEDAFYGAIADWLDETADKPASDCYRHARRVARLYQGMPLDEEAAP